MDDYEDIDDSNWWKWNPGSENERAHIRIRCELRKLIRDAWEQTRQYQRNQLPPWSPIDEDFPDVRCVCHDSMDIRGRCDVFDRHFIRCVAKCSTLFFWMTNTCDIYEYLMSLPHHYMEWALRQIGEFFLFSHENKDQLVNWLIEENYWEPYSDESNDTN
jgi:hypothetical protein